MRQKQSIFSLFLLSPSSWRAWIEIRSSKMQAAWQVVALLTEGVDRNQIKPKFFRLLPCLPPRGGRG